eukprot:CAMPEP_0119287958 /NCGR_PEP_ID=MMETSP1329-20130426/36446_1 /TAXON_ID=114041 /ORGANISM="Genus nov. species nov., Strain RCC1024" /LENGTH=52 /DNA_ID=CAMNT_0007288735 /DNA_START=199 /DNA_END=354 /DNA_ORIENTATION=-
MTFNLPPEPPREPLSPAPPPPATGSPDKAACCGCDAPYVETHCACPPGLSHR